MFGSVDRESDVAWMLGGLRMNDWTKDPTIIWAVVQEKNDNISNDKVPQGGTEFTKTPFVDDRDAISGDAFNR